LRAPLEAMVAHILTYASSAKGADGDNVLL
jgi:hypothetical protein